MSLRGIYTVHHDPWAGIDEGLLAGVTFGFAERGGDRGKVACDGQLALVPRSITRRQSITACHPAELARRAVRLPDSPLLHGPYSAPHVDDERPTCRSGRCLC